MASQTHVEIIDEVAITYKHDGILCFQAVRYHHPGGQFEDGFRFIWRDGKTGNLKALRGQTRIPSMKVAFLLLAMAADRPKFCDLVAEDAYDLPPNIATNG